MQAHLLIVEKLTHAIEKVAPACKELGSLVRPTQDAKFGDFQINAAMPIGKKVGKPPREVAEEIVAQLSLDELCSQVEIAGPGFINLTLRDDWLSEQAVAAVQHPQLGIAPTSEPKTIVIDFSSPNIAKPMHVGHIRSSCIGDALSRVMRFLGHNVITDNHLGDWGTQFGMVIYGYRHFVDPKVFEVSPIDELLRVYRIITAISDYHAARDAIAKAEAQVAAAQHDVENAKRVVDSSDKSSLKKNKKSLAATEKRLRSSEQQVESLQKQIANVESDHELLALAMENPDIANAVLQETAKLHAGDEANVAIWNKLLPYCMDEINRVYDRLDIQFDHVLGESFYHPMLEGVVEKLAAAGLSKESDGATCVFLPEFDAPMIVRKKDGAFLYATTDLATIQYRHDEFSPDEILYVVDFRQGEHFEKLFAAAKLMGYECTKFVHVAFGTVLDKSGRPMKTRSGSLAGLMSLLDDAVASARSVVCDPDRTQKIDPPLSESEQNEIAEKVGIGAIKYADLSHHRTSDYRFNLEKMVALDGNTSAYIQYAYARIQGIFRKAKMTEEEIIAAAADIELQATAERALVTALLRFESALQQVREEYAPNVLVDYLYEIAKHFASMFEQCPVLKAETDSLRLSRLTITALTGRTLQQGLALLGIQVVPRM